MRSTPILVARERDGVVGVLDPGPARAVVVLGEVVGGWGGGGLVGNRRDEYALEKLGESIGNRRTPTTDLRGAAIDSGRWRCGRGKGKGEDSEERFGEHRGLMCL